MLNYVLTLRLISGLFSTWEVSSRSLPKRWCPRSVWGRPRLAPPPVLVPRWYSTHRWSYCRVHCCDYAVNFAFTPPVQDTANANNVPADPKLRARIISSVIRRTYLAPRPSWRAPSSPQSTAQSSSRSYFVVIVFYYIVGPGIRHSEQRLV
jgi:hypothetical protein